MKSGKCPKCGKTKIIVALPGEYGNDSMEHPMTVTAEPRWVLWGRNPNHGHGILMQYVCRACGFTEWWVDDPEKIPIGEKYKTALLNTESERKP